VLDYESLVSLQPSIRPSDLPPLLSAYDQPFLGIEPVDPFPARIVNRLLTQRRADPLRPSSKSGRF
jgi:hypothetical protein